MQLPICVPIFQNLRMKQVVKGAVMENLNVFEKMKAISIECSVEEAVYHIMPELWLQNKFLHVVFANSNLR